MASRVFWRRSATAAWVYAAVVFGILGTVVAARVLGLEDFGIYVTALAAVGFFQVLLDLTVEEPLTKFGFRYIVDEEWGKLRRLFVRALSDQVRRWGSRRARSGASRSRRRHDLRRRRARRSDSRGRAHAPGAGDGERGRDGAPAARAVRPARRVSDLRDGLAPRRDRDRSSARGHRDARRRWSSRRRLRRSPSRSSALLPSDASPRRPLARSGTTGARSISFTLASSVGTGVVSLRTTLVPLVLGIVAGPTQVGLFRIAQTPQTGLSAASSPARLVLLTDQTRAWERGRQSSVLAGLRAYTLVAVGLMIVAVPVFLLAMPWLVETVFGSEYSGGGGRSAHHPRRRGDPVRARLVEVAAGDDRPSAPADRDAWSGGARRHPAGRLLGSEWGATGAAVAVLVATIVFAVAWGVAIARLRVRCRRTRVRGRRRRPREGPDRLGDLAARRRWSCESCTRARRLPARAAGTRSRW